MEGAPCQASSRHTFLPVQVRLQHIGPEEFVQAFVNKDPLASTKVEGPCTGCPCSDPLSKGRGVGGTIPLTSAGLAS